MTYSVKCEIKTIRDLVLAVEAREGMDDLRQWYAEDFAQMMTEYKKIDLIEMVMEGRQPISNATVDEIAEHVMHSGLTLEGAVDILGDLAKGLLPPKLEGAKETEEVYRGDCPYCGRIVSIIKKGV